jgi:hypothetical protein
MEKPVKIRIPPHRNPNNMLRKLWKKNTEIISGGNIIKNVAEPVNINHEIEIMKGLISTGIMVRGSMSLSELRELKKKKLLEALTTRAYRKITNPICPSVNDLNPVAPSIKYSADMSREKSVKKKQMP